MKKCFYALLIVFISSSCNRSEKEAESGPLAKLTLELLDNLMVEELSPLVIDDYLEETDHFLMKETRSSKPYLVDNMGVVLEEYDILNEGPNGLVYVNNNLVPAIERDYNIFYRLKFK